MQEASGRAVDRVGARPTIISREMHIAVTAMYDAWAAYDAKAVGTRLGGALRRPRGRAHPGQQGEGDRLRAPTARCSTSIPRTRTGSREQMRAQGHDPDDASTDVTTPQGVGNVGGRGGHRVPPPRRRQPARRRGGLATASRTPTTRSTSRSNHGRHDPRSRPLAADPVRRRQGRHDLARLPHAALVPGEAFALERSDQFRPGPPPKVGSAQLSRRSTSASRVNGSLTPRAEAVVEFMRDGPRSTGQSGHWLRFAADVSRRDRLRPRPGREAVLRGRQRRLRRVHRVLGDEALLRQLPPVDAGPPLLQGQDIVG